MPAPSHPHRHSVRGRTGPGRAHRVAVAAACVLGLLTMSLLGATGAGAGDTDENGLQKLSIRRIDSLDPDHVKVSLIYNGPKRDLPGLTVREGGQQRKRGPVETLAQAGVGTAVVFAIDLSPSMGKNGGLQQAKTSMLETVDELAGDDRMAIVGFGTRVTGMTTLSADKDELRKAIAGLQAPLGGRTALFGGVQQATRLLSTAPALQPNLVLVTDGYEDASEVSEAAVRSTILSSRAAVFALAYNQEDTADTKLLTSLVKTGGGQLFQAPRTENLAKALATVRTSLKNQFIVEYASVVGRGATDIEVTAGGASDLKTYVPGGVAQGENALGTQPADGSSLPGVLTTGTGKYLALGAIFLAVALAVYAVATLMSKDESSLEHVLMPYTEGYDGGAELEDSSGIIQTPLIQRAVAITEGLAHRRGFLEKLETKLERANLPLRAGEVLFFYSAGVVLIEILLVALTGPFIALLGLLLFGGLPPVILKFLAKRRQKRFNAQLPDMLQLLAGSLRAGYSLVQGVEAVSQEVTEPMGRELRRVVSEARLGRDLEEALEGVGQRMDSADFEWAVMAVRIQREVGGNLSELLMTVSETMISRERMRREVAALTAEGKISAIVLGILPPGLGVTMYVVNPAYMKVLFTETVGQGLLVAGTVAALVGFAWMKKMVKIEI